MFAPLTQRGNSSTSKPLFFNLLSKSYQEGFRGTFCCLSMGAHGKHRIFSPVSPLSTLRLILTMQSDSYEG